MLEILLALIASAPTAIDGIMRIAAALNRSGELTDAEWQAFKASCEQRMQQDHWKPNE